MTVRVSVTGAAGVVWTAAQSRLDFMAALLHCPVDHGPLVAI